MDFNELFDKVNRTKSVQPVTIKKDELRIGDYYTV